MAHITLKGNPIETIGELPALNTQAPPFTLTDTHLLDSSLSEFTGKTVVLSTFPSIDTPVCSASVRHFNKDVTHYEDTVVLCISADLPFTHQRICEGEGLKNIKPLSVFRSPEFGKDYGVTITTGPLKGLLSRAIIVINKEGKIVYTEQVPEITSEPNYEAALNSVAG